MGNDIEERISALENDVGNLTSRIDIIEETLRQISQNQGDVATGH